MTGKKRKGRQQPTSTPPPPPPIGIDAAIDRALQALGQGPYQALSEALSGMIGSIAEIQDRIPVQPLSPAPVAGNQEISKLAQRARQYQPITYTTVDTSTTTGTATNLGYYLARTGGTGSTTYTYTTDLGAPYELVSLSRFEDDAGGMKMNVDGINSAYPAAINVLRFLAHLAAVIQRHGYTPVNRVSADRPASYALALRAYTRDDPALQPSALDWIRAREALDWVRGELAPELAVPETHGNPIYRMHRQLDRVYLHDIESLSRREDIMPSQAVTLAGIFAAIERWHVIGGESTTICGTYLTPERKGGFDGILPAAVRIAALPTRAYTVDGVAISIAPANVFRLSEHRDGAPLNISVLWYGHGPINPGDILAVQNGYRSSLRSGNTALVATDWTCASLSPRAVIDGLIYRDGPIGRNSLICVQDRQGDIHYVWLDGDTVCYQGDAERVHVAPGDQVRLALSRAVGAGQFLGTAGEIEPIGYVRSFGIDWDDPS